MNRYKKNKLVCFLLLCLSIGSGKLFSQGLMYISNGEKITVTNAYKITLFNSKLTNQGTITTQDGLLYFTGNANKSIAKLEGTGNTQLDDLIIDKSANDLALHTNIKVNSQVSLSSGGIELVSGNIDLDLNGDLTNEINTRRIYGTGGEIIRKMNLSAPNAVNPANLGAIITTTAKIGITTIIRGHKSFLVNGSNSALRYYKISPTSNSGLNATLRFSYFDEELNGVNESDMQIWYSVNNGVTWVQTIASQRNPTSNFIEINKLDNLAWYTIAPPCKPISNNFTRYVSLDSSFFFKGQNRNTTGVYKDTLLNAIGCDSFPTLNLIMKPMTTLPTRDTILRGGKFTTLNGTAYTTSQVVRDTIRGAVSDTIRVFNVYFNIPKVIPSSLIECQNTYTWRGKTLTKNGIYRDTVLQKYTDTIYELNLTLSSINVIVSYINGEFVSNCTTCTSFQWYVCNADGTKSKIVNSTSRTLTAVTAVYYSVEVTGVGGCVGNSTCVTQQSSQTSLASNKDMKLTVYPNPFQNQIFVSLDKLNSELEVSLMDMTGKKIFNKTAYRVQKLELDMKPFPSGNYILQLNPKEGEKATFKLTKE